MAQYSPGYREPIVDKDELDRKFPSLIRTRLVKAAENYQSSSKSYDPVVQRFINILMNDGKRRTAQRVMDKTYEYIKYIQLERYHKARSEQAKSEIELNPSIIFHKAVENTKPALGTQPVIRGGVQYTVPIPLTDDQRLNRSLNFLQRAVSSRDKNTRIWERLARELIDASNNTGSAVRKKQELHRICEQNRQYARFRW